jgi:hypothetical protein
MESAINDLNGWLNGLPLISVHCLIAEAGSGKTRLGIDLCSNAEQEGWPNHAMALVGRYR